MSVEEIKNTTNERVINCLKNMLKEAENGNVHAVAIATLDRRGVYSSAWSGGDYSKPAMIGAIENLKFDFIFAETDMDISRSIDL